MKERYLRFVPGQIVNGIVVSVLQDEVYINIGYKVDGLIKRADLVDQDVKVGDEIKVAVVEINCSEGDGIDIICSQRIVVEIETENWEKLMHKYYAGECVEGIGEEVLGGDLIADVMGFRVFIPASLISYRHIEEIDEFVGRAMELRIIAVDKKEKRVIAAFNKFYKAIMNDTEEEIGQDISDEDALEYLLSI